MLEYDTSNNLWGGGHKNVASEHAFSPETVFAPNLRSVLI
ncbi:MAG: hypothetical protein UX47_C0001G0084 [Candidatus Collierbacteria bacterium GW2011_GWA2_46_26]|uniref:Uncharacterized protein n=1 Tax=Candidatus Collierbacteria bacterium GW2011_GWA2_46_26 TaxID=1618381 RepID=A0A0G1PM31_9BACT|nr:MAG: hypothetical protein UW29_C0004G0148 [Candidatus Collierbacteria bacterium GW2011_GWC2_44_13]KKU33801.1 MAG: hypothetical protein UX47_C0001G0084 [Candidatus Collierbacteria bacterium GW2011_GWA2_46_26]